MLTKMILRKEYVRAVFLGVATLMLSTVVMAQVPQVNKNYTIQKVYDDEGNVISYIQTYNDKLGRTEQTQQKDLENDNVIVQQTLYDRFGRGVLQTLPAPVYETGTDNFLSNFMVNTANEPYGINDFDKKNGSNNHIGEVYNPAGVGNEEKGSLGWYYSNENDEESHVAASPYPYVRQYLTRDARNTASISAAAGTHFKMGSNYERRILFKHRSDELKYILGGDKEYYKSVSIDEEGLETVNYTDAEGKLVAQCYSGDGIDNCIPRASRYELNVNRTPGTVSAVDLHIPVGGILSIEKVLPTSACTTITPDVLIYLTDLTTGKLLTEGVDYNFGGNDIDFLGFYTNRSRFIKVSVEFPSDWLNCANTHGAVNLKNQIVTLQSFYGGVSLYSYDSKGNLIQVIPPNGVTCMISDPSIVYSPGGWDDSGAEYLFGATDPTTGDCIPNHNRNSTLFISQEFVLDDKSAWDYTYFFHIGDHSAPLSFEGEPPFCDDDGITYNYDNFESNNINPETGELMEGEIEEEELPEGVDFLAENIDVEMHFRQYAADLYYRTERVPEIVLEELEPGTDELELVDIFLDENYIAGISTPNISLTNIEGETDTTSMTNGMLRKRNGTSLYELLNGGGGNPYDPNDNRNCIGDWHCSNGIQDCDEVGPDVGGSCGAVPACYGMSLNKRGSFKVQINAKAKNRTSGVWEPIDVFKEETPTNSTTIVKHDVNYLYLDLMYDCECNYYLYRARSTYESTGTLSEAEMDVYEQLKVEITQVYWAPGGGSVNVYRPANTHNVYEYMAHFIQLEVKGSFRGTKYIPGVQHDLTTATTYEYNFYNQVTRQTTPDEGETNYYYDEYDRLKFTQTAVQAVNNEYSYVDYDNLDRPIESGVVESVNFPTALLNTQVGESSLTLTEVHNIEYDSKGGGFPTGASYANYEHLYLKGKVSKTTNANSTTWYGYDQRGRISWTVQEVNIRGQKYFTVNYSYDSQGNVAQTDFQKHVASQRFVHHYSYDANGRLVEVKTSTDGIEANAEPNANYEYYQHGPLKRVELGGNLQGVDYVYTINGRLKSINNPSLLAERDPGQDGIIPIHLGGTGADMFGLTLDYFRGDYQRSGTNIQTYSKHSYDFVQQQWLVSPGKRDGTLEAIRWQTRTGDNNLEQEEKQLLFMPEYDARKRMTSAVFGSISNTQHGTLNGVAANPIGGYYGPTPTVLDDYKVWGIEYDKNGNLLKLNRNGNATDGLEMDELVFTRNGNQLEYITDQISISGGTNYATDLESQSVGNYSYDVAGRLTSDALENNFITYRSDNLTKAVYGDAGHTALKGEYFYDEKGFRLQKTTFSASGNVKQYTIRDVSGNVLVVIDDQPSQNLNYEYAVYGADQLGFYKKSGAEYLYQLKDHLGNVRATIKDDGGPSIVSMQDYYPFGSKMPGRGIASTTSLALGFQGQPEDGETGFNSFKLRLYDARIGGWLSPDPYKQHFSPYMAMSNNPLSFIDPDGGMDGDIGGDGSDIHISEFGGEFGLDDPLGYAHDRYNNGNAGQRYLHKSGGLSASYSNWEQFGTSRNSFENTITTQITTTTIRTKTARLYSAFSAKGGFQDPEVVIYNEIISTTTRVNSGGGGLQSSYSFNLLLAVSGTILSLSEAKSKAIIADRSGYSVGSYKGKLYDKRKALKRLKFAKGGGLFLVGFSTILTEDAFVNDAISPDRRKLNHLDNAVGVIYPIIAIPIAVGDHLGESYSREIIQSVENGLLFDFTNFMLSTFGFPTGEPQYKPRE